jgi:alkanesulfonate monooxygenase SsuD/methylene tetrahydromethanopterin reductase-like flavin-dependent oxidoreductase (luciferase family)
LKVGLILPQAGQGPTVRENLFYAAKQAEEIAFDSVWTFERLLWPTKPQTPYPATPDGSLPIEYRDIMDPLETLSFVAAYTRSIRLGTSVKDILFHNPVVLAR